MIGIVMGIHPKLYPAKMVIQRFTHYRHGLFKVSSTSETVTAKLLGKPGLSIDG